MHHGYYVPENRTDHQQAQIDLIDEVLKWAGVTQANSMVDVGCGIGGSSRHIARKFDCKAQGITLSPYQANRGNELALEQGISEKASFQVRTGNSSNDGWKFVTTCNGQILTHTRTRTQTTCF